MAKSLKDILAGVKSSKVVAGSTGSDAGVDYKPKSPDEQDFVALHKTEVHADRVGNGDDVYKGKTKEAKYQKQSKATYEEVEEIEEISKELASRYVKKAVNSHGDKTFSQGFHSHKDADDKDRRRYKKKADSRQKSIGRAVDKLSGNARINAKEETECVHTESGKDCPVHGMTECPETKGKKLRKLILGGKKDCGCNEEVELDEISKELARSYTSKAMTNRPAIPRTDDEKRKSENRHKGIVTAQHKAFKNKKKVKVVATEETIEEREMTSAEKKKETAIKKKTDPSGMKASMKKQYGAEKGKQVYFATIRKQAMKEDLAIPMLEGGKKKKAQKESAPGDTPITFPSGNVGDTGRV